MTAPIDIECPACKSTAGNYCTMEGNRLTFYHAQRVDEAFRANTRRQHDPRALRKTLREALDRLAAQKPFADPDNLQFIDKVHEEFGL